MKKGVFIVLDGNDGSGKATQTRLLAERLTKEKVPLETFDFPSYNRNFFGTMLADCLSGKCGDFVHLDPKIASTLYALDRFEETPRIKRALSDGKVVITDRFSSSNQIHQGGKIEDTKAREEFLIWLDGMEHTTLGIPRPDAVLYFDVPLEISLALLEEKRAVKNAGVEGKDQVEQDRQYLAQSYEAAKWLASRQPNWHVIQCAENGVMRSREAIHEDVYRVVSGLLV
ncbi:thymidylate kinase [Patescibacteria group bacterium]|nr:thymidylate kinase [Patescibacteria group bacterium]